MILIRVVFSCVGDKRLIGMSMGVEEVEIIFLRDFVIKGVEKWGRYWRRTCY